MIASMNLDCHIFILWILILIVCFIEQECCRFGPGPNCCFPCRCTQNNVCYPDTGACLGRSECQKVPPDGYGWEGPGCRIGNVAYAKINVNQSGLYDYYTAELAVDGVIYPYVTKAKDESCAHPLTLNELYAWWWLDLGDIFTIQRVTLVNRLRYPGTGQNQTVFDERSTDYDIKIGNTSERLLQTLCFHQDKPGDEVQHIETMTCDTGDMVGRYVSFTRTGGRDPDQATICEFIVMGYKPIECHRIYCNGACDSVIGCAKCAAGKKLPDCQEGCPDGYWGVNCANTCGKCRDGFLCDKVTGSCGSQCDSWYIPQLCAKLLRSPPLTLSVTASDIRSDSATILWDRSTGFDVAVLKYFYYIVHYRRKNDDNVDDWKTSNRIPLSNDTSFQYKLSGLGHDTEYEVQIIAHRAINGRAETGTIDTTTLKTLCIVPDTPPAPSIHGTLGMFTVTWDPIASIFTDCNRLHSVELKVTCENSTHTILNQTYDILMANKAFTYETPNAISCSAMLYVTNSAGFSSASAITTITKSATKTTTVTLFTITANESEATQQPIKDSGPNVTAIVVGAVAGVLVISLVVVIGLLALRRRSNMPSPNGNKPDSDTAGHGKPNPVYENAMHGNDDMQVSHPAVHSSTEVTNTADNRVPDELYENTKEPESQYQSLDDTGGKPSTVYQELT